MLPDNEDWFWRPFMRGKLTWTEYKLQIADLADIATVNELLDFEDENTARIRANV